MCLGENIKVVKIGEEKINILMNLLSLYLHDLSEFSDDLKISEEGKYVPGDAEYSIHEIFILKSFRGKGVATIAIKKIFEMYKGKYKVEQLQDNKLAVKFWNGFYKKQNIVCKEEIEVIDGFNCCTQVFNI